MACLCLVKMGYTIRTNLIEMALSIITPHYNDLEGLKRVYTCLQEQTLTSWNWVIVDDKSDFETQKAIEHWCENLLDAKVQLFLNKEKTNASVCRNLGADLAKSDIFVFLDADDVITKDFVANRNISFTDFAVFKNTAVLDKYRGEIPLYDAKDNYLNYFLSGKFIWPITAVLWRKSFFNSLGKFHPELPRLQDVELVIRALQKRTNYSVIDNSIDFYYRVKPIRERKNFVPPVCDAVHLFISKLLKTDTLNSHQVSLVSGYYFLCVRYLERSGSKTHIHLVQRNLKLFYKKKYIGLIKYVIGYAVLQLFKFSMLSGKQFVRINRYLFKPTQIHA
jgi:glycosyltransferase involved in cell wall biosynthesis